MSVNFASFASFKIQDMFLPRVAMLAR